MTLTNRILNSMTKGALTPRTFGSMFDGTCTKCKCPIRKGDKVVYTKGFEGTHVEGSKSRLGREVAHAEGCGYRYKVRCHYHASSKDLGIMAFGPKIAIDVAHKQCQRRLKQSQVIGGVGATGWAKKPIKYTAYLDDVPVLVWMPPLDADQIEVHVPQPGTRVEAQPMRKGR